MRYLYFLRIKTHLMNFSNQSLKILYHLSTRSNIFHKGMRFQDSLDRCDILQDDLDLGCLTLNEIKRSKHSKEYISTKLRFVFDFDHFVADST